LLDNTLAYYRPANLRWNCVFSRFNKLYQFKIKRPQFTNKIKPGNKL